MVQKLLDALKFKICSHQFAWPRRAADGQYYQVCVLCAAQFEYDWNTTHRTRRAAAPVVETATATRRSRDHVRGTSWTPRAARLDLQSSARFRERGKLPWHPGLIENLSQSGLLLATAEELAKGTLVELVFAMPEQVSGEKPGNVLCQTSLIRSEPSSSGALLGLSILDYKFLPHSGSL